MMPIHSIRHARALAGMALAALCAAAPLGAPAVAQEPPAETAAAIARLVEQAAPAIVSVEATRPATAAPRLDLAPDGDVMGELFRRFGGNDGPRLPELPLPRSAPNAEPTHAAGSGFVIDPGGLIVTADALVADAGRVRVTLDSGETRPAEVAGRDPRTGLALLRVDAGEPLPALSWGDGEPALGQELIALGRAEGFGATLSAGRLAARAEDGARLLIDDEPAPALLGAPVLDEEGRVAAIRVDGREAATVGTSLAVGAEAARDVVDELARNGAVSRGYLGVQVQPVTQDVAEATGLDRAEGAMVAEVSPRTPADEAGLRVGDVILSLEGEPVPGPGALSAAVARLDPGDAVRLEVWRSEEVVELTATLAALPADPASAARPAPVEGEPVPELGLTLHDLTPDLREARRLPDGLEGVAVLEVQEVGPDGIEEGDVIVSVHRTAVAGVEDVRDAVAAARTEGRGSILLLVDRAGERSFVPVPFLPG